MSLTLEHVCRVVDQQVYIDDACLSFEPGSFNVLVGRTLAGKTSLMRLMAGLDKPTEGTIHFDGEDVTGVPMSLPVNTEGPLVGCAILASVGAGLYGSIQEAAKNMMSIARTIEPRPGAYEEYDFYFHRYLEIYRALEPIAAQTSRHIGARK